MTVITLTGTPLGTVTVDIQPDGTPADPITVLGMLEDATRAMERDLAHRPCRDTRPRFDTSECCRTPEHT